MATQTASVIPLVQIYESLEQQDPEWLETTLRQRWQKLTVQGDSDIRASTPDEMEVAMPLGPYDITGQSLAPSLRPSEHLVRFRSHDWASTDLGCMSSWPLELRRMVNLCMADPRPVALWWGPNRILLHNDAYRSFLQERYEWALGKSVTEVWHDVPSFPKNFDIIDTTGEPVFGEDTLFFVKQPDGRFEELWTSWAIIALPGATGNIGYYNSCSLNTRQIIYERRMSTLLALERHTSSVSTVNEFWTKILQGLKANPADVPFAALYSAEPPVEKPSRKRSLPSRKRSLDQDMLGSDISSHSDVSSSTSGDTLLSQWVFQGVLESTPGQLQLPHIMDFETGLETLGPLFKIAIETRLPQILRLADGTFPKALQGRAISRAYGDLCHAALLIPIPRGNRRATAGCLLLGLNSRASYDDDYQRFISMLKRQLSTSMNSVIMVEDEARHLQMSAELAARDRLQLAEKLDLSEQDAKEKEMRFRSMADQAPIPMFESTIEGELLYVNDSWYVLTGHPRNDFMPMSWVDIFHPDDRDLFATQWSRLTSGEPINFEMRLKKPYVSDEFIGGERLEGETWISTFGYAEKSSDGTVRKVLGSVVDISHYKWMQNFQERRTADALELKRQQEAFMDMTSHEARNPLSAISLCVESITSTLGDMLGSSGEQIMVARPTIESTLESAETIMACVAHQKRIIDDVLTLSKINSGLLLVSPVDIQPVEEVRRALRLFDGELQQAAIELQYDVDQSYQDLQVDWVLLDPTRLLQILINLLTNAIKFTKDEAERRITVTLLADHQRPANNDCVKFMPNVDESDAQLEKEESTIYLSIRVEDTGRGIEDADLDHLFQRFQQGSPKTHVKYGGSGLGLFICKELARLQGGQIGVSAARGKGSNFAFFVRATRCSPPAKEEVQHTLPVMEAGVAEKQRIQHVLLVEDNLVNQKVMAKQLRSAGYRVTVANHGQEALDHILTTHFCKSVGGLELDVVLMDIEMPVMGGLECSRRLRDMQSSGEVTGKVPLIAITANVRAEQQKEALGAGYDAVVTKPFRMGELVLEMEQICGG